MTPWPPFGNPPRAKKICVLNSTNNDWCAGKASKPEDMVRLYDGIIQGLQETGQLSGLEEDEAMAAEVEAQIVAYKGL